MVLYKLFLGTTPAIYKQAIEEKTKLEQLFGEPNSALEVSEVTSKTKGLQGYKVGINLSLVYDEELIALLGNEGYMTYVFPSD